MSMKKKNILLLLLMIIGCNDYHNIKATEASYGKCIFSALTLLGLGYAARYCYQKLFTQSVPPQPKKTVHDSEISLWEPFSKYGKNIVLIEGTKEDIDIALNTYKAKLKRYQFTVINDLQMNVNRQLFLAYQNSLDITKAIFIPWPNKKQEPIKLSFFNSTELAHLLMNSLEQDLQKNHSQSAKIIADSKNLIAQISEYAYQPSLQEQCFTIGKIDSNHLKDIMMYLTVYAAEKNISISTKTISKDTYNKISNSESLGYLNGTIFFVADINTLELPENNDFR